MKKIIIALALICLFTVSANAQSYVFEQCESASDICSDIISDIDISSLKLPSETEELLGTNGNLNQDTLMSVISDGGLKKIFLSIKDRLLEPLKFTATTLSAMFVGALLTSSAPLSKAKKATETVVCLIFICAVSPFMISLINECSKAVGSVGVFMYSFIPVFIGIVAASMKTGLAAGACPSLFIAAQGINFLSSNVIIPLCSAGFAVGVSSGICFGKLRRLTNALKKTVVFILSLVMSVFLGVLTLKAAVYSTADSLGLKTAKFLSGSFIPIVGSSVSEMISGVAAGLSAVSSTIGIFGIIATVLIVLPTAAQILAYRACVAVCSYICELFERQNEARLMKAFGDTLSIMLALICVCSIACIFSVAIVTLGGKSI